MFSVLNVMKKKLEKDLEIPLSLETTAVAYVTSLPQQHPQNNACGLHVLANMKVLLEQEAVTSLQTFNSYATSSSVEALRWKLVSLFSGEDETTLAFDINNSSTSETPSTSISVTTQTFSSVSAKETSPLTSSPLMARSSLTPKKPTYLYLGSTICKDDSDMYLKGGTDLVLSPHFAISTTLEKHVQQKMSADARSYVATKRRERALEEVVSSKLMKIMSVSHIKQTLQKKKCSCQKKCFMKFSVDDVASLRR